jgi:hypothetical protein
MQILESALAFAITMLVLSLICSSFVELIHRVFSMREAGLKYMLRQMFDQVLAKYVTQANIDRIAAETGLPAQQALAKFRESFVARMSANRAPMGVPPDATPTDRPREVENNPTWRFGLWSGRELTSLTPKEFMERLGSIDLAQEIKKANDAANQRAGQAGTVAADATDRVLKDIAQKFEAFGNEARAYFEGRARLLSVLVAIGLAFAAHVDAVDLFRTYLRDPNARAKVIEQAQAVTSQYEVVQKAEAALKSQAPVQPTTDADIQKQVEKLKTDWRAAIGDMNKTIAQYADLGVPIGWTEDRIKNARMRLRVWTCPDGKWRGDCDESERNYWFQFPTNLKVWFFLFLGGLLIGLGSPFWYNAVTGLTNIRSVMRDITGASAAQASAALSSTAPVQPVTPAQSFAAAQSAKAAAPSGGP